ncbi:MAG: P-II family nitrogen regulator [Acidobacteriota bacterium]
MSGQESESQGMFEVKAVIRPFMLEKVLHALAEIDAVPGVMVSAVRGWGRTRGQESSEFDPQTGYRIAEKTRIEVVLPAASVSRVTAAIASAARTGRPGDGKIFVYRVTEVVRIRTGEHGEQAI